MIRGKMNEKILRAYINASNDWRFAGTFFVAYVVLASVTFVLTPHVMAGKNILEQGQAIINDLAGAIITISTAAALVGVGTGAFLKKFSLGKPDRIETGNKLISNSIWAWIMINGLTIILRFFAGYFDQTDSVQDTWGG
jgi:protein-S-isoprenylcysteine O-methyltransferase Ste14